MNMQIQEQMMLLTEVIKLTRLLPYGKSGKHQCNEKTTRGHPHSARRRNGKPRFASTCKICREERITRY